MAKAIHTSDSRYFKRLWQEHGFIFAVTGTGEVRDVHPAFRTCVRTNDRRKDVPAKLLTRLNTVIRLEAANDARAAL